ncbi:unnamed protein product, partial [Prorocentrum cordatum]
AEAHQKEAVWACGILSLVSRARDRLEALEAASDPAAVAAEVAARQAARRMQPGQLSSLQRQFLRAHDGDTLALVWWHWRSALQATMAEKRAAAAAEASRAADASLATLRDDLERAKADATLQRGRAEGVEDRLAQEMQRVAAGKQELESLRNATAAAASRKASEHAQELESLRGEAAAAASRRSAEVQELESLRSEAAAAAARRPAEEQELEALRGEAAAAAAAARRSAEEQARAVQELESLRSEVAAAASRRSAEVQEIETLRKEMAAAATAAAGAVAEVEDALSVQVTVDGLSYAQVVTDVAARGAFEDVVKRKIANGIGRGVEPSCIDVQLLPGSLVVVATVRLPAGVSPAEAEGHFAEGAEAFGKDLADELAARPALARATRGAIVVSSAGAAARPGRESRAAAQAELECLKQAAAAERTRADRLQHELDRACRLGDHPPRQLPAVPAKGSSVVPSEGMSVAESLMSDDSFHPLASADLLKVARGSGESRARVGGRLAAGARRRRGLAGVAGAMRGDGPRAWPPGACGPQAGRVRVGLAAGAGLARVGRRGGSQVRPACPGRGRGAASRGKVLAAGFERLELILSEKDNPRAGWCLVMIGDGEHIVVVVRWAAPWELARFQVTSGCEDTALLMAARGRAQGTATFYAEKRASELKFPCGPAQYRGGVRAAGGGPWAAGKGGRSAAGAAHQGAAAEVQQPRWYGSLAPSGRGRGAACAGSSAHAGSGVVGQATNRQANSEYLLAVVAPGALELPVVEAGPARRDRMSVAESLMSDDSFHPLASADLLKAGAVRGDGPRAWPPGACGPQAGRVRVGSAAGAGLARVTSQRRVAGAACVPGSRARGREQRSARAREAGRGRRPRARGAGGGRGLAAGSRFPWAGREPEDEQATDGRVNAYWGNPRGFGAGCPNDTVGHYDTDVLFFVLSKLYHRISHDHQFEKGAGAALLAPPTKEPRQRSSSRAGTAASPRAGAAAAPPVLAAAPTPAAASSVADAEDVPILQVPAVALVSPTASFGGEEEAEEVEYTRSMAPPVEVAWQPQASDVASPTASSVLESCIGPEEQFQLVVVQEETSCALHQGVSRAAQESMTFAARPWISTTTSPQPT